jgi:hypothetical protein
MIGTRTFSYIFMLVLVLVLVLFLGGEVSFDFFAKIQSP